MVKSPSSSFKVGALYRFRANSSNQEITPCFCVVTTYNLTFTEVNDSTSSSIERKYVGATPRFFIPGETALYIGSSTVEDRLGFDWKLPSAFVHEFLVGGKGYKLLPNLAFSSF